MLKKSIFGCFRISVISVFLVTCGFVIQAGADNYTINVNAGQKTGIWGRFYEQLIATDHMNTMLSSAYGRNMQGALKRGAAECGFKYFRGHGIFNIDIGLYTEPNGVPTYNWTKFDSIYDIALSIGLRPILEFSFTPQVMASGNGTALWYNGAPGYITMPKDLNKWKALCRTVVEHCEARYGINEVRKWYFEVFNEPDLGTFFSGSQQGYFNLYDYASEGVREADSLCKVGGPATSATNPTWIDAFLKHVLTQTNASTGKTGSKCDFISYHRYADDPGFSSGTLNPASQNEYNKKVTDYCTTNHFTGLIINDEWGPCAVPTKARDDESDASFIIQTIHMLTSNGAAYPPPFMYGYWCISDIYEEMNAWAYGKRNAYDEGNYGLTLRGDAAIPESYDIAKPAFNAFKLLHKLGDSQLSCTGGAFTGANAIATINNDSSAIQVLVYEHSRNDSVAITINNIPISGPVKFQRYLLDSAHSNSYRVWVGMGKPKIPTTAQWIQMRDASALSIVDSGTITLSANGTYTSSFAMRKYSASLIVISDPTKIAIRQPAQKYRCFNKSINAEIVNHSLSFTIPSNGIYNVTLLNVHGELLFKGRANGMTKSSIALNHIGIGTYFITCSNADNSYYEKVINIK